MKIVLIGGGSFVFAPTVIEDAVVKHRLSDAQLVLVDLNAEAAEAMAGAAKRAAAELGVAIGLDYTTDRKAALPGADFVIVSAAPQGAKRWTMDYGILQNFGMPDQARECGGLGGLLSTFRSVAMIMDICRDMEALCPNAVLLDVTNPMPRVVTAVERFSSVRSYGFCNIAYRGPERYDLLPMLLGRNPSDLKIATAGLNHFAWATDIRDAATGEDLLPALQDLLSQGDWSRFGGWLHRELGVMRRWYLEHGGIVAGHIDHHGEWLPTQPDIHYPTEPPYHGTPAEREQRLQELREIGAGRCDYRQAFARPSWEHPIDVAVALHNRETRSFDIVNIRNDGALPGLPDERIVEVPVTVEQGRIRGVRVRALSDELTALLRQVSDVHEASIEAAVKGDRQLAAHAVEIDPAIPDKKSALRALDEMLDMHADMLPHFSR